MFDNYTPPSWNPWDPATMPVSGAWQNWDPTMTPTQYYGTDSGDVQAPTFNVDPQWLSSVGYNGPIQDNNQFNQQNGNQSATTDPALINWLNNNGYKLQLNSTLAGTPGASSKQLGRLVDAQGNQIGQGQQWGEGNDDAFGIAALLGGGFAGAAAAGVGAGAAGAGADAGASGGGLAGTGLPEYSAYGGAGSGGTLTASSDAGLGGALGDGAGFASPTTAAGIDSAAGTAGYGASSAGLGGGVGDLAGIAGPTAGGASGGGFLSSLGNTASDATSWMKANPGLTNIGGGIVNGLIGAYTSNNALNAQKDATNQANALLQPYRDTGIAALGRINGLMANPSSIASDPGYQFGLNQGTQGVNRSAAAAGNIYSGATLKALDRYGQDYAGTKLNDAYSRYGSVAQLGATGTQNMANNTTGLGNAAAGTAFYQGNTLQNGVNNALGQMNFQNGGYYGNGSQNPFNQSTYQKGPG